LSRCILDACALLAMLRDEPGADKVAAAINAAHNGEAEVVMHKANLLEVYYDLYRSQAGRLKASYKISFADSFALAQALVSGDELLTADHHEFEPI